MSRFNEVMKYGFDIDFKRIPSKDFEMEISNDFAGFLIGKKGKTIKEIRKKVNCEIDITKGVVRYVRVKDWLKNLPAVGQVMYKKYEYDNK